MSALAGSRLLRSRHIQKPIPKAAAMAAPPIETPTASGIVPLVSCGCWPAGPVVVFELSVPLEGAPGTTAPGAPGAAVRPGDEDVGAEPGVCGSEVDVVAWVINGAMRISRQ